MLYILTTRRSQLECLPHSCHLVSCYHSLITALLATVIFVVVQVVICKCHPKFRPGGTKIAGGEGQEYEQMDGGATETGILVGEEGQEYEMVVGGYEGDVHGHE